MARAEFIPQYFFFDRAIWSPDSRQVVVVGRYTNHTTHESFEDTLLVDVGGRLACVSPSMYEFTLSRDRRRIVGRGRFGLYDYELATGRPRRTAAPESLRRQRARHGQLLTGMAGVAVVAIRCNPSGPDSSGVWSYPLAPGQPTKVFSDPYCGPSSLNFWRLHRREVAPTEPECPPPAIGRPRSRAPALWWCRPIAGASPASSCAGRAATRSLRELPHGVRLWPPRGWRGARGHRAGKPARHGGPGRALAGQGRATPRRLREEARRSGGTERQRRGACCTLRPGRMLVVDASSSRSDIMNFSLVPEWGRRLLRRRASEAMDSAPISKPRAPKPAATRTQRAPRASPPTAPRGRGIPPVHRRVASSQGAVRQLPAIRKARARPVTRPPPPATLRVYARTAASMAGSFDFGSWLRRTESGARSSAPIPTCSCTTRRGLAGADRGRAAPPARAGDGLVLSRVPGGRGGGPRLNSEFRVGLSGLPRAGLRIYSAPSSHLRM